MHGLLSSFNPLLTRYKAEVLILGIALLIGIVSIILFLQQKNSNEKIPVQTVKSETHTQVTQQTITVDISGAVAHPFVYTVSNNARIIDVIQKAGGLTEAADKDFVSRNFNYARLVSDQEKIYIPYLSDTANGIVLENKRILDYSQPNISHLKPDSTQTKVNINSASSIELDQLPGIGKVTAEAIVNARPYTSLDELVTNSVIKQSVYDKIKELISVY